MNGHARPRALFGVLLKRLRSCVEIARLINLGRMKTLTELQEEREPRGVTEGETEHFSKFQLTFIRTPSLTRAHTHTH